MSGLGYFGLLFRVNLKMRELKTKYFLSLFFGKVGKGAVVFKQNMLINPRGIFLGDKAILLPNSRIELIERYKGDNFTPRLILGNNSQIHQNAHITCAELIELGDNVIVVSNVTITDIVHPHDDINVLVSQARLKTSAVTIGAETYIYNNAVILPGTKIGKHCIIGASSVVSGTIPDYSIVVGSPGKIIKQYNFETNQWQKV